MSTPELQAPWVDGFLSLVRLRGLWARARAGTWTAAVAMVRPTIIHRFTRPSTWTGPASRACAPALHKRAHQGMVRSWSLRNGTPVRLRMDCLDRPSSTMVAHAVMMPRSTSPRRHSSA